MGKYLPRAQRWPLFVSPLLIGLVLLSGCEADPYPSDLIYPLRTDPLVLELPTESNVYQPDPLGRLDTWIANLRALPGVKTANPMDIPADQRAELERELRAVFGRPSRPLVRLHADKNKSEKNQAAVVLQLSDPVLAQGSKLYRQHCLHCHGVSGNGRGPTAAWVNPHPRDYRRGYFKFTSVVDGGITNRARREDLSRTLHEGVEGTTMPNFKFLSQKELDALVSYVIHLSLRGEVEFGLMAKRLALLAEMAEQKKAESQTDPEKARQAKADREANEAKLKKERQILAESVQKELEAVTALWVASNQEENAILGETRTSKDDLKDAPYPYAENPTTPREMWDHAESVQRGHQLFLSGEAGCVGCHKDYGRQNPFRFDKWGTLVRPADLTLATYRGGRRPIDLYYRIHSGIDPSGMPAQWRNLGKDPRKLWDLVNFVHVLPYPDRLPSTVKEAVYDPVKRN